MCLSMSKVVCTVTTIKMYLLFLVIKQRTSLSHTSWTRGSCARVLDVGGRPFEEKIERHVEGDVTAHGSFTRVVRPYEPKTLDLFIRRCHKSIHLE